MRRKLYTRVVVLLCNLVCGVDLGTWLSHVKFEAHCPTCTEQPLVETPSFGMIYTFWCIGQCTTSAMRLQMIYSQYHWPRHQDLKRCYLLDAGLCCKSMFRPKYVLSYLLCICVCRRPFHLPSLAVTSFFFSRYSRPRPSQMLS